MAELHVEGDELVLHLSALEKGEALHGDLRVPLSSAGEVEVLDDAIHAVHGLKFPGSRWPGRFAIGTFVHPFRSSFMALGDGRHKLPIKAELQKAIAKKPGETVTVVLQERLEPGGA